MLTIANVELQYSISIFFYYSIHIPLPEFIPTALISSTI